MIDRQRLLDDLKPLLKQMEADLRARCDEVAEINAGLEREYNQARAADRTGATFEEWRADLITQVAVAWVLSCVFVRFLEDNGLISPPRISGPMHGAGDGHGMMRARDERDLYFKSHPKDTDRDYLVGVFDDLAKLPGTKDVFGPHNPVSAYRNWLSGDAAQKLIEFFQKLDTDGTGEIIHDFTDPITPTGGWDTRFLGDLYQDLSEAARKKYALLQTPVFVEEFILERTLEPAINEFGLKDFKMIDPACGSGHFLLGSFARILALWRKQEPGTPDRELVNRALAAIHGVDLNPYAVAIARFRLLVAAMRECHVTKLKDAPAFAFSLVCGDSLLHGSPGTEQQLLGFHELAHAYRSEDLPELKRILKPGSYHAVVANPPYITVKDKALNQAYRERYPEVCHRQYSLSVPFLQRLFVLACDGGYTGQITANSFMKREFGKKLIEQYTSRLDLTHIVDTSLAFIPGHGTPTVILLGRNRPPQASSIRCVMGIRREDEEPRDPARGLYWSAVISQIDQPGSESTFLSVGDVPRTSFNRHPWSIGGGGAAELKELLEKLNPARLAAVATDVGVGAVTREDDAYMISGPAARLRRIPAAQVKPLVEGDVIRDWCIVDPAEGLWPYNPETLVAEGPVRLLQFLWPFRRILSERVAFGLTQIERGLAWYEYSMLFRNRLKPPLTIAFVLVATHNQFAFDRGGRIFKHSAPIIKLSPTASEADHIRLLSILNSSTAGFWMRQVFHDKGGGGIGGGIAAETWERFFEYDATKLKQLPLPSTPSVDVATLLDTHAQQLSDLRPGAMCRLGIPAADALAALRVRHDSLLATMIALQEELDWEFYRFYGLLDESTRHASPTRLNLGQRAFEIVLARKMAAGELQTTWFERHGSTPITQIPAEWPEDYRRVVQRRIEIIESDRSIALIERPEYKRRWNTEPWEEQQERALRGWLLDRLESYFDMDGRMNDRKDVTACGELREPRLTSVAKVADLARVDKDFMQVAELYAGRMDFDVANLVGELVAAESVPALPVVRYKPSGLDKRTAWERTWDLQRLEDAVGALFEVERLKKVTPGKAEETLQPMVQALRIDEQHKPAILRDIVGAAGYVAEAAKQNADLTNETILRPVADVAKRARKTAIGDVPVPPKYVSADFLSGDYWRLRGKLDVPKERWVSFPHCEGEDGTLVIAWAGCDHLQLARAIAERYELAKEQEGRKLVPLLAAIGQLIPWLKQWHNELDPTFNQRMGDYFEKYLAEEAKAMGKSVDEVMAWTPPEKPTRRKRQPKGQE